MPSSAPARHSGRCIMMRPAIPAGCVHHGGDEHQAEVKLPDLGDIAQHVLQVGDEHRTEDRTEEEAGAADESRRAAHCRTARAEQGRVGELEVDGNASPRRRRRRSPTGRRRCSAPPADCSRRTARARDCRARHCTCGRTACASACTSGTAQMRHQQRDQVVDLDLRAEVPVEDAQQLGAVGR